MNLSNTESLYFLPLSLLQNIKNETTWALDLDISVPNVALCFQDATTVTKALTKKGKKSQKINVLE